MTELEKMERARMYLSKLADGVNPLTDEELPGDTVLNNVRLARCFFYAADVLRRVVENGGEIRTARKTKRADFALTPEQAAAFPISAAPIRIGEIVERLNSLIDTDAMKKISTTAITGWLVEKGFLYDEVRAAGKKTRLPTDAGVTLGLSTEERKTMQGTFTVILYNADAQVFLIDHLEAITAPRENHEADPDGHHAE